MAKHFVLFSIISHVQSLLCYLVTETIKLKFLSTFELLVLYILVPRFYICTHLMGQSSHMSLYVHTIANRVRRIFLTLWDCRITAFRIIPVTSIASSTALRMTLCSVPQTKGDFEYYLQVKNSQ